MTQAPSQGWHRADIVAAVHKKGTSLLKLAREHKLADSTLRAALHVPRTPSNRIIAGLIGVPMHELWPKWFDRQGKLLPSASPSRTSRRSASSRNAQAN